VEIVIQLEVIRVDGTTANSKPPYSPNPLAVAVESGAAFLPCRPSAAAPTCPVPKAQKPATRPER
jgi:hypothetical protein